MKALLFILLLGISFSGFSQVSKISLQASGLTCSMCSNSINKSLKTLDFVEKVTANIKTSTFDITLKPGVKFNFDQVKKKVEDAGFFVAKMSANMRFNGQSIQKDEHIEMNGMVFHFLNAKSQNLTGEKSIQVVDKGYVSAKDFKKNQLSTSMECYKTGVAGSCCSKSGLKTGTRIYHVTI